ncbi:MAG: GNAT family N-acetyltransferase [Planctomycetota bacterium]|jgi:RimJ/RimL family protein N-acetyltransferase
MHTIQTERLQLRPWAADDLEAFHRIWGDPEVIWWGPCENREKSREILHRAIDLTAAWPKELGWFAVVERASGEIVGNVFLRPSKETEGVELGYHFARSWQGRGYATEATRSAVSRLFDDAGADRVVAYVLPENAASQRVAAKIGMRKAGTILYADLLHDLLEIRCD